MNPQGIASVFLLVLRLAGHFYRVDHGVVSDWGKFQGQLALRVRFEPMKGFDETPIGSSGLPNHIQIPQQRLAVAIKIKNPGTSSPQPLILRAELGLGEVLGQPIGAIGHRDDIA
ncbi:MAG: hypothetical protein ABSE93_13715 [Terriglobia bacterium]